MEERRFGEASDTESIAASEYSFGGKSNYSFVSSKSNTGFASAIRGQETLVPTNRFTLYKVEVNNGERTWIVYRRYSDFVLLNKKLKKLFPGFVLSLPPKRIFMNNFDKLFITKRQKGLEEFMKHLFSLPDVMKAGPVRQFFRLDNPPGPHEDLTASRDYCESLEATISRLKKDVSDQDYELSHLRSELARIEYNGGNQSGFHSQTEASFTEKVLQQKLIAAEELANQARQEVERMRIDLSAERALEQSTRMTERHQRELQIKDLMNAFHARQQEENEAVRKMAATFSGSGILKLSIPGGQSIDVRTNDQVVEKEEELKQALEESRMNMEELHKQHLENLKKVIEDQKSDLVRAEYQLQTARTEIQSLRDALGNLHSTRNEEMISRDRVIHEYQSQLTETRQHIESTEQKYFYSLLLGVKLNMALWGKASEAINQMRPHLLFAKVRNQGVTIENWPGWVSRELASISKSH